MDWSGSEQGQVVGACQCGNKPSHSIKCGEFLYQLRACQLRRKDSAPWSQLYDQVNKQIINRIVSLDSINRLFFEMDTACVFCEVDTEILYVIQMNVYRKVVTGHSEIQSVSGHKDEERVRSLCSSNGLNFRSSATFTNGLNPILRKNLIPCYHSFNSPRKYVRAPHLFSTVLFI